MLGQNLVPTPRLVPKLADEALRKEFQSLLNQGLEHIKAGRVKVKIPRAHRLMQRYPGMHYHFRPEIFLQLGGATEFRFPEGGLTLLPGEVAILPAGLPHGEKAIAGENGQPFRNFVVGFYSSSVSMHFAAERGGGRPDIESIAFYTTPDLKLLVDMVEYQIRLHHSTSQESGTAVRGLSLALCAILLDLTRSETPDAKHDSQRVFQVKWLVRDQLYNPELNVTFIAKTLNCSPDYLSNIYHKETGETLIHYIQRQRVTGAIEMLNNPGYTISQISWACGFSDAGYFTRVFRKQTGMTPLAYRAKRLSDQTTREKEPKTIYHDRVDFSPGSPVVILDSVARPKPARKRMTGR